MKLTINTEYIENLILTFMVGLPIVTTVAVAWQTWHKHKSDPDTFGKHWRVWRNAILTIILSTGVGFGLVLASLTN
ncbi:hypothetical protein [Klebsiella oxytoca]|uniref:hypothetical protein n=1 Tax=Klebsiella oxytoca TaxID=571 RepID=UPI0005171637|nr:hypothetical protein [Klebsiella oxytoca]MBX4509341.1 hypothetical protein [Klebsiella oxytoca]RAZ97616.1 hypothetical protein DK853_18615 [Klebsiella oxytoca]HBU6578391.1 hypothetical protein [Klebsiella oxytoca]HDX8994695.1 hypothetical protein [Klebsiella oxytoca]HDY4039903.1 hypothetical protein [Klebsiella oxytoca]